MNVVKDPSDPLHFRLLDILSCKSHDRICFRLRLLPFVFLCPLLPLWVAELWPFVVTWLPLFNILATPDCVLSWAVCAAVLSPSSPISIKICFRF
ncbi:Uncharacterized protein APZ42_026267 [Daphnia magna]|uniref:Uncharacterized protein n=1 Tax=Daphnia magna TaxID=35525 RepID=A0A0P6A761_9CRUS|nr:Uncharacterized protein APZ42_026267 [Daphnia magna]